MNIKETTLTQKGIEELRIAIAEDQPCNCGYGTPLSTGWLSHLTTCPKELPYTTSLDAIQQAALDSFKDKDNQALFIVAMSERCFEISKCLWQLTALDWCIAYARTAKIWRWKV